MISGNAVAGVQLPELEADGTDVKGRRVEDGSEVVGAVNNKN